MPKGKAPAAAAIAPRYIAAVDLYSDSAQQAYPAGSALTGAEFPQPVLDEWLAQGVIAPAGAAPQEVSDDGR